MPRRLTSIDRVVLVECVPALESIKDSFFVRVQDHLGEKQKKTKKNTQGETVSIRKRIWIIFPFSYFQADGSRIGFDGSGERVATISAE